MEILRDAISRLGVWLAGTWLGRFVSAVAGAATAYFVNRLSVADPNDVWRHWEFYATLGALWALAAVPLTIGARNIRTERKRRAVSGFAEVRPTSNFTGRDLEIRALDAALVRGRGSAVVLCGPPGMGKSTLAREFAHRKRHRYSVVWWLSAGDQDTIIDGLLRLDAVLDGRAGSIPDRRAAAEYVWNSVLSDDSSQTLLILDDLGDESLLRSLSSENSAHIVATSEKSASAWQSDVTTIQLGPISDDLAVHYLERESRGRLSGSDAKEIVRALAGWPLALAHAAAYFRGGAPATARSYVDQVNVHLAQVPADAEYPRSVFATIQESIAKAEALAPGAASLLCLCACMNGDSVAVEFFEQDGEVYSDGLVPALATDTVQARDLRYVVLDEAAFERAFGMLKRLSLIAVFEEARSFNVHRLVQAASLQLAGDARPRWAEVAVAVVDDLFPDVDVSAWPECERLLPHALAALENLPGDSVFPPAATLAFACALYLHQRSAFDRAEALYRRSLVIEEAVYGAAHARIAPHFNHIGDLLAETSRLPEAAAAYQRALMIDQANWGPDHSRVAGDLVNLGTILFNLDHIVEAEEAYRRALTIDLAHGESTPAVARDLHELAMVLARDPSQVSEAERFYRRSIAIYEACRGPDSDDVAVALTSLGILLGDMTRFREAESLFRRALEIHSAHYGPEHPKVATNLRELAIVFIATKRFAAAEPLVERALLIDEPTYGPRHPKVARGLGILASIKLEDGRTHEAEHLLRRALSIDESNYGPNHHHVAASLKSLADICALSERHEEAEALYRRAMQINATSFGVGHPAVAIVMHNLGILLAKQYRDDEAEDLLVRACAIFEGSLGSHHKLTVRSRDAIRMLERRK